MEQSSLLDEKNKKMKQKIDKLNYELEELSKQLLDKKARENELEEEIKKKDSELKQLD